MKPREKQKGITFGYCDETTGERVYPPMTDLLPDQLPPVQQAYQAPDQDGMFAKVTCTPPLGQQTIIAESSPSVRRSTCEMNSRANVAQVHFAVLLETDGSSKGESLQVLRRYTTDKFQSTTEISKSVCGTTTTTMFTGLNFH